MYYFKYKIFCVSKKKISLLSEIENLLGEIENFCLDYTDFLERSILFGTVKSRNTL